MSITKFLSRYVEVHRINRHYRDIINSAEKRDLYYVKNSNYDNNRVVTDEMRKEIDDFWKPYEFAYKNNPETQIAFYQQSGVFDPSYLGFGLQRFCLNRFWNNPTFSTFRNKNYSNLLFPFVKSPKCYLSNSYGIYFDENKNTYTQENAIKYIMSVLKEAKECILKPTLDSGCGVSIMFLDNTMSYETIKAKFNRLGSNFVCQEIVKCHESYRFNGNSFNTLRIITLFYKNEFRLVASLIRIALQGRLDNWGQGGVICSVDENGVMGDFAITEKGQRFTDEINGIKFAGHTLYKAKEAMEAAINCHKCIPQQNYISWDFGVDTEGNIVFIEMNSPGGSELPQALGMNAYGNKQIAKEIFDEYMIKRFFFVKATYDWDYREFSDHISLVKYHGKAKNIKIPDKINGKKVTNLYDDALDLKQVKSLSLPKNCTYNGRTEKQFSLTYSS